MRRETPDQQPVDFRALQEILHAADKHREALIPVLQAVQEHYGYVPPNTISQISQALGLFPTEVQAVVTFYAQFSLTPRGKNVVRICRGTACHVRGGRGVLRVVKNDIGIEEGQTTDDLKFTLETVACLGACALAPVMVVNQTYYGKMNPNRIRTVLHSL